MKRVGFLSSGHGTAVPGSQMRTAQDAPLQVPAPSVTAERIGVDGA